MCIIYNAVRHSLQALHLAMLSRRALFTTFIQVGIFFLVCYFITLLVPADSGSSSYNLDDDLRTNIRCPDCIFTNIQDQRQSSFDERNTLNKLSRDKVGERKSLSSQHTIGHVDSQETDSVSSTGSYKSVRGSNTAYSARTASKTLLNSSDYSSRRGAPVRQLQVAPRGALPLKPNCRDPLCTEHLTEEDKYRFNSCLQKVKSNKGHPQDGQCHFMPQTHRAPVALASYPGSGNTWLRGLLETATGICTGFEFCDISMRVKGFAGENIVSGAVSVVKTHGYPRWTNKMKKHGSGVHFDSAVVLMRNPLHALVAEWSRRVANNFHGSTVSLTSHVKSAGKEMFGTNPKWVEFLREQVPRWQSMVKEWVTSHGRHSILVIKYEDLQRNASLQVKRILTFLQIPYRNQDIDTRLSEGFHSFHRTQRPNFEHYTPGQKQRVLRAINDTIQLLNAARLSHLLDIQEYLHQGDT